MTLDRENPLIHEKKFRKKAKIEYEVDTISPVLPPGPAQSMCSLYIVTKYFNLFLQIPEKILNEPQKTQS